MSDTTSAHDEAHGVGHLVPLRILIANGVALLILTVVTVAAAQFDFGAANITVALAIAGVKASLVVLFFMHLRWDRPINAFIFVTSIAFVLLFIGISLHDTYEYREDMIKGEAPKVQQRLTEMAG